MSDKPKSAAPTTEPSAAMRALGRLVGTWDVTGGATGRVSFSWLPGEFLLLQQVELEQEGQQIRGIEVIGHLHPFMEEPEAEVRSRFYDNAGNTLDYVYELEGDVLTVWGGEVGSPAYNRSTFRADGATLSGAWVYPGGGGYASTMTRSSDT